MHPATLSLLALLAPVGIIFPNAPPETICFQPVPQVEPLSTRFTLSVAGHDVPVYNARICNLQADDRRHMLWPPRAEHTDLTSFASVDVPGPIDVTATCSEPIQSCKILPGPEVTPTISGKTVTFTLPHPGQWTVEVNGNWINALHVFANPPETNVPDPHDPNVIYFAPGIHTVHDIHVTSNQTVYLAPGAVVYGEPDPAVKGVAKAAVFTLEGDNITLRGRGIIDGSRFPSHTGGDVAVFGNNIKIEGVTLRDSSGFTLPVRRSKGIDIDNVKLFGWRQNSDGMDICNSHDVHIHNCFLRTFDDLIVLKTDIDQGDEANIRADHCVLWNELAHALNIGAEIREPISDVTFSDCDIIHDKGREWLLRVYHCDSAPVKNVTFDHIRIEEARKLMSVWIGKAIWSRQAERGHVNDVTFQNIDAPQPEVPGPFADLVGFDATHAIDGVTFTNVTVAGQPLTAAEVKQNPFVHDVTLTP
jgi:hypothetical protein